MNTKQIISLAILAALPCAANATGPAAYTGNSPVVATASAPYQTVTPGNDDDKHIASTKYVIGAYNDAIAAVNKVAGNVTTLTNNMNDKQDKLLLTDGSDIDEGVYGHERVEDEFVGIMFAYPEFGVEVLSAMSSDDHLITMGGVTQAAAIILEREGVEIYTTWEDDSATTGVLLKDVTDILP